MRRSVPRKVASIAVLLSLAFTLAHSTKPVYAHSTESEQEYVDDYYDAAGWTWQAAGREALTWGVCGAVGGAVGAAAFTAFFGTPAAGPAALIGGAAGAVGGAVGGFLTYAAGYAYDRLIGRYADDGTIIYDEYEMASGQLLPANVLD